MEKQIIAIQQLIKKYHTTSIKDIINAHRN